MSGHYLPYSEYKSSGEKWIGNVPEHWDVQRLGQYFEERREKVSDKDYQPLSVTMNGIVPQLDTAAKTDDGDNRKLVLKDDFVINSRSDRKGSSGVSALEGSVSLISIVMKPRDICPNYVHHLLRSYPFQEEFYRYGKGIVADLWSTNASEMRNIKLPIPSKPEQEQIAIFLDQEVAKIDTLIEKQQQLIKLLKEKRQAVISHAVTKGLKPNAPLKDSGVEWLGQVPREWSIVPLKYLVTESAGIQIGPFGGMLKDLGEVETGYKVFGQENTISGDFTKGSRWISKERFEDLENYHLTIGDILLTRKGSLGNARLVDDPNVKGIIDSDTIRIRLDDKKILPELLSFLMHNASYVSEQIARNRRGAILPGLNTETISNIFLVVPQSSDQCELLEYLQLQMYRFCSAIVKCTSAIDLLEERRVALISAAVTGKIDVREWQPAQSEIPMEACA